MTAIGRGDGEALVPYSLETTIDVGVGWGGRGGLMDIVEIRYRGTFGHKKGNRYKIYLKFVEKKVKVPMRTAFLCIFLIFIYFW